MQVFWQAYLDSMEYKLNQTSSFGANLNFSKERFIMSVSNIQEVFGKFAVELEDGAKLFDTHAEALAAETEFLKGAEFREEAAKFNAYAGNEGKNAKGKANVLIAYFAWVEAGRPEAPEAEEVEEAAEAEVADIAEVTQTEETEEEDDINNF